jgi:hypothetical protein
MEVKSSIMSSRYITHVLKFGTISKWSVLPQLTRWVVGILASGIFSPVRNLCRTIRTGSKLVFYPAWGRDRRADPGSDDP